MARMIRKQIYIESRQDNALKREATRLGISEAEVIRRRLDRGAEEWGEGMSEGGASGRLRRSIEERMQSAPIGSHPTRTAAWEDEKRFIEERAELLPGQSKGRSWTRDELYEERRGRVSD